MTLQDLKAECERDKSMMDAAHAEVDKLSSETESIKTPPRTLRFSWMAVGIGIGVSVLVLVAMLSVRPLDDLMPGNHRPVIDNYNFLKSSNELTVSVNASDEDDLVRNFTVEISAKALDNKSYQWPPVVVRVYWINQSSAALTEVLSLANLQPGDYRATCYVTDSRGATSSMHPDMEFTIP